MYYATNVKTLLDVSSFVCLLCMCFFFIAFEEAVLKFMYLGECPKIKDGRHFHGNKARGEIILVFFSIFFHTDHNKCTMK